MHEQLAQPVTLAHALPEVKLQCMSRRSICSQAKYVNTSVYVLFGLIFLNTPIPELSEIIICSVLSMWLISQQERMIKTSQACQWLTIMNALADQVHQSCISGYSWEIEIIFLLSPLASKAKSITYRQLHGIIASQNPVR